MAACGSSSPKAIRGSAATGSTRSGTRRASGACGSCAPNIPRRSSSGGSRWIAWRTKGLRRWLPARPSRRASSLTEIRQPGAAVVGTGFGLFTHVRALRDAGFEVRAIVGRDRQRTQERARPLGIPLATDSLAEALNDPAISLVTVATPPHAHFAPVMQAIAAGRHVVCEKPFARDLAEAREMLAEAENAGIIHMLGAEFRFDSAQALLRRVVKDGLIGTPLHFLRIYHQPGLQ